MTRDEYLAWIVEHQKSINPNPKKCGKAQNEPAPSDARSDRIALRLTTGHCIHLGPELPNQTCGCAAKLRKCGVHNVCTTNSERLNTACCATCTDYESAPNAYMDDYTRHLIYYVYPVQGNGQWQLNLDRLKKRLELFNGRRIIAVSVNSKRHTLDDADYVRSYFGKENADFIYVPHKKKLGEVTAFTSLWKKLERFRGEKDVTFYAHSKGVISSRRGPATRMWADLMYKSNLDHWEEVRTLLESYPIVGAFRRIGPVFGGRVEHHYHGTFYWCRNKDVFSRDWVNIPMVYGGTEMWPGMVFKKEEAGCIFYPMKFDQTCLGLYDLNVMKHAVREYYKCYPSS